MPGLTAALQGLEKKKKEVHNLYASFAQIEEDEREKKLQSASAAGAGGSSLVRGLSKWKSKAQATVEKQHRGRDDRQAARQIMLDAIDEATKRFGARKERDASVRAGIAGIINQFYGKQADKKTIEERQRTQRIQSLVHSKGGGILSAGTSKAHATPPRARTMLGSSPSHGNHGNSPGYLADSAKTVNQYQRHAGKLPPVKKALAAERSKQRRSQSSLAVLEPHSTRNQNGKNSAGRVIGKSKTRAQNVIGSSPDAKTSVSGMRLNSKRSKTNMGTDDAATDRLSAHGPSGVTHELPNPPDAMNLGSYERPSAAETLEKAKLVRQREMETTALKQAKYQAELEAKLSKGNSILEQRRQAVAEVKRKQHMEMMKKENVSHSGNGKRRRKPAAYQVAAKQRRERAQRIKMENEFVQSILQQDADKRLNKLFKVQLKNKLSSSNVKDLPPSQGSTGQVLFSDDVAHIVTTAALQEGINAQPVADVTEMTFKSPSRLPSRGGQGAESISVPVTIILSEPAAEAGNLAGSIATDSAFFDPNANSNDTLFPANDAGQLSLGDGQGLQALPGDAHDSLINTNKETGASGELDGSVSSSDSSFESENEGPTNGDCDFIRDDPHERSTQFITAVERQRMQMRRAAKDEVIAAARSTVKTYGMQSSGARLKRNMDLADFTKGGGGAVRQSKGPKTYGGGLITVQK